MLRFVVCKAESNSLWRCCEKFFSSRESRRLTAIEYDETDQGCPWERNFLASQTHSFVEQLFRMDYLRLSENVAFNWDKHCVGSRISNVWMKKKTNYEQIAGNEIIIAHHIQQQRFRYNWLQSRTRNMRQWQPAAVEEEEEHKKQLRVDGSTAMSHVATT